MFTNLFTPESWAEAVSVIKSEFLLTSRDITTCVIQL